MDLGVCNSRCTKFTWRKPSTRFFHDIQSKHCKNCECCPVSQFIVRYMFVWIQLLNFQNCNQLSKLSKMIKNSWKFSKIVPNCLKLSKIVQNCPKLSKKICQNCQKCQNNQKVVKLVSNHQYCQNCQMLSKFSKTVEIFKKIQNCKKRLIHWEI